MRFLLLAAALFLISAPQSQAGEQNWRERETFLKENRALPDTMPVVRRAVDLPVSFRQFESMKETRAFRLSPDIPGIPGAGSGTDLPANFRHFEPAADQPQATGMHIGPVQTEMVNGRVRYRIEGVSVMGGSVSGSLSGRGAKIFLRWRNN